MFTFHKEKSSATNIDSEDEEEEATDLSQAKAILEVYALGKNDFNIHQVEDCLRNITGAKLDQELVRKCLVQAIESNDNQIFSELTDFYNSPDNDVIEAILRCTDDNIVQEFYEKFGYALLDETKQELVEKAAENNNTNLLDCILQEADPEDEFIYSKIILQIVQVELASNRLLLANSLLESISTNIGFRAVAKIILYLCEDQELQQHIPYFINTYDEPVNLWAEINDLTDDLETIEILMKFFDGKYPNRKYLGNLNELSSTSVARLIIILIKHGNEKKLIGALIEKKGVKALWEELQLLTIEEIVLKTFITIGLASLNSENKQDIDSKEILIQLKEAQAKLREGLYSPYPIEAFKGDVALSDKRNTLYQSQTLQVANKVAATLIGYPLSTHYRFFPNSSPYHATPLEHAERYFRGGTHPLHKFFEDNKADSKVMTHKMGGLGNIPQGTYRVEEETKKLSLRDVYQRGDLYDYLLEHRQATCLQITRACEKLNFETIKVGFYHQYPCLMVHIAGDAETSTDAEKEGWTQLVISFFVGLINYKARAKGLPIELIRRSSFGFLIPTIAPCTQSFRINVGVIPTDYAEILAECLHILDGVLKVFANKKQYKKEELRLEFPTTGFLSKEQTKIYGDYKGSKLKAEDILEVAHTGITKDETNIIRTGAVQLAATPVARIQMSAVVFNYLVKTTQEKADKYQYANAFLKALQWGFGQCYVSGDKLTFIPPKNVIALEALKIKMACKIADKHFFKAISEKVSFIINRYVAIKGNVLDELDKQVIQDLQGAITKQDITGFYYNLEKLNEVLFAKIISFNTPQEETYGSDSDIDEDKLQKNIKIYGKKAIVNHGMMAIMRALEVATATLKKQGSKPLYVFFHGAYYEVEKDFSKLKKALQEHTKVAKAKTTVTADIIVHDLNHCVTTGDEQEEIDVSDFANTKIWILDTTSTTINEQHASVEKFRQTKNSQILFLVSSGLKNEQMGSDKMAYGTIRFFAKDKKILDSLTKSLRGNKELICGLPHNYRRLMKVLGFVPSNNGIVDYDNKVATIGGSGTSFSIKSLAPTSTSDDTKDKNAEVKHSPPKNRR